MFVAHTKRILLLLCVPLGLCISLLFGCSPTPSNEQTDPDGSFIEQAQDASAPENPAQDQQAEPPVPREAPSLPEEQSASDRAEPTPDPPPEPTPEDAGTPDDGGTLPEPEPDTSTDCQPGEIFYIDRCLTAADYCPTRYPDAKDSMATPYELIDGTNFCKTQVGHFYLPGSGYAICDKDGDGWVTIEAYRAANYAADTDDFNQKVRDNARCDIKTIQAFVYHREANNRAATQTFAFVQALPSPVPLIESNRNDGQGPQHRIPVYTKGQAALPVSESKDCDDQTPCTSGQVCYLGNCVEGTRFDPKHINTLTKACVQHIDLNHNDIPDSQETPSSQTNPSEFQALLRGSYFAELHYGAYQKDYMHNGQPIPVFHIIERERSKDPNSGGLSLQCKWDTGKYPGFWRFCHLRDDQTCKNGVGHAAKGLSDCWMEDVQRGTPSLFKCVHFDGTDSNARFYITQQGLDKTYTRSVCDFGSEVSAPTPDKSTTKTSSFTCKLEETQPQGGTVGWACMNYKSYPSPADYEAGCINECIESTDPAGSQPCGQLYDASKCIARTNSWGRYDFGCPLQQAGSCYKGEQNCQDGVPQTCQQIAAIKPDEVKDFCDGKDDDCDGQIDEDATKAPCYTGNSGCTKNANGQYTCVGVCKTGNFACKQVTENGQTVYKTICENSVNPAPQEICNGKDDNCNGAIDELPDFVRASLTQQGYGNIDGTQKTCTKGAGACRASGKLLCQNNTWVCDAKEDLSKKAPQENCTNNVDDDCNGYTNDYCLFRRVGTWGKTGAQNAKPGTLNKPTGVAWFRHPEMKDANGTVLRAAGEYLYLCEYENYTIRRIPLDNTGTNIIGDFTTIAGTVGSSGAKDGSGDSSLLGAANAIVISHDGRYLYVAERQGLIRRIDLESQANGRLSYQVFTIAGIAGNPGCSDGAGSSARFKNPTGLALNPTSTKLYVADVECHNVREIDLTNSFTVTTIAGSPTGQAGYKDSGTGNAGTSALLDRPHGLAMIVDRFLFVADTGNASVRLVDLQNRASVNTFISKSTYDQRCSPPFKYKTFTGSTREIETEIRMRHLLATPAGLYVGTHRSSVLCRFSITNNNSFLWRLKQPLSATSGNLGAGYKAALPPLTEFDDVGVRYLNPTGTEEPKYIFGEAHNLAVRSKKNGATGATVIYVVELYSHTIRFFVERSNL